VVTKGHTGLNFSVELLRIKIKKLSSIQNWKYLETLIMECVYCGGMIEPRHKFCLNCGRSIRNHKNGSSSIHPKLHTTMFFKCNDCGSKLVYNKKAFRFWCESCMTYRFPDPDYYDFRSLKMSRNLYINLSERTITDIHCPVCNSKTHFDITFGRYWCGYCSKYTSFFERDEFNQISREDHSDKKFRV
jgi:DNA-directed RNA polymerase subunit RPC12/RpoP